MVRASSGVWIRFGAFVVLVLGLPAGLFAGGVGQPAMLVALIDSKMHGTATLPGYEAKRAELAAKLSPLKTCAGQGCRDAEDAP